METAFPGPDFFDGNWIFPYHRLKEILGFPFLLTEIEALRALSMRLPKKKGEAGTSGFAPDGTKNGRRKRDGVFRI